MPAAFDEDLDHLGYFVLMEEHLHTFGANGHEELEGQFLRVGAVVL